MRILVAEDDLIGKQFLHKFLVSFGECDIASDGLEVLETFLKAQEDGRPYDLICLDIMMPRLDGIKVLKVIRDIENQKAINKDSAVKIIMTTALNDKKTVTDAFAAGCDAYMWKPIDLNILKEEMKRLKLISDSDYGPAQQ